MKIVKEFIAANVQRHKYFGSFTITYLAKLFIYISVIISIIIIIHSNYFKPFDVPPHFCQPSGTYVGSIMIE